jgi:hypothetical protein
MTRACCSGTAGALKLRALADGPDNFHPALDFLQLGHWNVTSWFSRIFDGVDIAGKLDALSTPGEPSALLDTVVCWSSSGTAP